MSQVYPPVYLLYANKKEVSLIERKKEFYLLTFFHLYKDFYISINLHISQKIVISNH
jgi:hypothetical protein